jgi:hypothetical protein
MKWFYFPACVLAGGMVLSAPASDKSTSKQAAMSKEAKLTMTDAEKIALAREPGTIKERELEREHGKLIYSFDIKMKDGIHEVNVDAITGDIVEDHVESAAAEAKEKKADAARKEKPKP